MIPSYVVGFDFLMQTKHRPRCPSARPGIDSMEKQMGPLDDGVEGMEIGVDTKDTLLHV